MVPSDYSATNFNSQLNVLLFLDPAQVGLLKIVQNPCVKEAEKLQKQAGTELGQAQTNQLGTSLISF